MEKKKETTNSLGCRDIIPSIVDDQRGRRWATNWKMVLCHHRGFRFVPTYNIRFRVIFHVDST